MPFLTKLQCFGEKQTGTFVSKSLIMISTLYNRLNFKSHQLGCLNEKINQPKCYRIFYIKGQLC